MRLSTKARYGVAAMHELSKHYNKDPVALRTIAQIQDFPEAYLEQLFAILRRERLIISQRGPKGGYMLARPPEDITVGEIILALEGPIEFSECVGGGTEESQCDKYAVCVTKDIWKELSDSINDVIDNITLKDLLNKYYN